MRLNAEDPGRMELTWIDTHAHLDDERFNPDLPAVLERAAQAGVQTIITIGIDRVSSETAVALASHWPGVFAAVGIHPNHVADAAPSDWDQVAHLARSASRVVAVGETGMDRHWNRTPLPMQTSFFRQHLALARQLNRPVIIHCREAEDDVLEVLRSEFAQYGPIRGVMHSFSGNSGFAQECLRLGLMISFAGTLTYKSAEALRVVAAEIPDNRLLIETDCPYLAPVPHRGKRNEPSFVPATAAVLAAARKQSLEALARQTSENATHLFRLPPLVAG
jgi:TatD DNase family protein